MQQHEIGEAGLTAETVDDLLARWAAADRELDHACSVLLESRPVVNQRTVDCVEHLLLALRPGVEARTILSGLSWPLVVAGLQRRRGRSGVTDSGLLRPQQGWSL